MRSSKRQRGQVSYVDMEDTAVPVKSTKKTRKRKKSEITSSTRKQKNATHQSRAQDHQSETSSARKQNIVHQSHVQNHHPLSPLATCQKKIVEAHHSFRGVRAYVIDDANSNIPPSNLRNFPVGSIFSYPIYSSLHNASGVKQQNVVLIEITRGASLILASASASGSVSKYFSSPFSYASSDLFLSTESNNDFLRICTIHPASSTSTSEQSCSLGHLRIAGPNRLKLCAVPVQGKDASLVNDGINVFGSVAFVPDDNHHEKNGITKEMTKEISSSNDIATNKLSSTMPLNETVTATTTANADIALPTTPLNKTAAATTTKNADTAPPTTPLNKTAIAKTTKTVDIAPSLANTSEIMTSLRKRRKLWKNDGTYVSLSGGVVAPVENAKIGGVKRKPSSSEERDGTTTTTTTTTNPSVATKYRDIHFRGGLVVRDAVVGTGPLVRFGRKVSITYVGSLATGGKSKSKGNNVDGGDNENMNTSFFDQRTDRNNPLTFRLGTGEVVRGLEKGLEGMRVGGERTIKVPSEMGYGKKGLKGKTVIPGDSALIFSVNLISVGNTNIKSVSSTSK